MAPIVVEGGEMDFQSFDGAKLELSFVIIPGDLRKFNGLSNHEDQRIEILNRTYEIWRDSWELTFKQLGSSNQVDANEFLRQSFLCVVLNQSDEIVAFESVSIFDIRLKPHLEHPYLKRFPKPYLDELRERKKYCLSTMEYLFVAPNYRKKTLGFSLSEVLCCLCIRLAQSQGCHLMMAVPRNDRNMNNPMYARGARRIVKDMQLHNVKADLLEVDFESFSFNLKTSEDEWINQLWLERVHHFENDDFISAIQKQPRGVQV